MSDATKDYSQQLKQIESDLKSVSEKMGEKFEAIKNLAGKEDVEQAIEQTKELHTKYEQLVKDQEKLSADVKNGFKAGVRELPSLKNDENFKKMKEKYADGRKVEGKIDASGYFYNKADMTVGSSFDGDVVRPQRDPAIYVPPQVPRHVREVLEVRPTEQTDTVEIVREKSRNNNVTVHTEGSTKTQSDAEFELVKFNIVDFAHKYDFTRRMAMDASWIEAWIRVEGRQAIMDKEDVELFNGTGDISGMFTVAKAFDKTSLHEKVSKVNRIDVLVWAVQQAFVKHYRPTRIYLHPTDMFSIRLNKDDQGQYHLMVPLSMGDLQFVGVPVFAHTQVPVGEFLIADNERGNYIADRMAVEVRFSEENNDNFEKNMITARIEKRFAHVIKFEDAFVAGDFEDAIVAPT